MKILGIKEPVISVMGRRAEEKELMPLIPLRTSFLPVSLLSVMGQMRNSFRDCAFSIIDLPNNGQQEFDIRETQYGSGMLRSSYVGASVKDYAEIIKEAGMVLMSCNVGLQTSSVLDTMRKIKEINSQVYAVCGGQEVSRNPDSFRDVFDLVWVGTGISNLSMAIKDYRLRRMKASNLVPQSGEPVIKNGGLEKIAYFPALDIEFNMMGVEYTRYGIYGYDHSEQRILKNYRTDNVNSFKYHVSSEGPLPFVPGIVIPFKMSIGCGRRCPTCQYIAKEMPLRFDPKTVKAALEEMKKKLYGASAVLLITDEITNLPLDELVDVVDFARSQGFCIDYGNTTALVHVAKYGDKEIEVLFSGESSSIGRGYCVGVCTNLSMNVLDNEIYRQKVADGLCKIDAQKPHRISINVTADADSLDAGRVRRLCYEALEPMRKNLASDYAFHIYVRGGNSPIGTSFFVSGNPDLDNVIDRELEKLNGGPIVDPLTLNYRYAKK